MNRKSIGLILIIVGMIAVICAVMFIPEKEDSRISRESEDIEYLAGLVLEMQDKIDELRFYSEVHERMRLDGLPLTPKKPVVKCYQAIEENPKPNVRDSGNAILNGTYEDYIRQFDLEDRK